MLANSLIHSSPSKPFLTSRSYVSPKPYKNRPLLVHASSSDPGPNPSPQNPLTVAMEMPKSILRRTLQPLSDFGFGRKSIWEGGVGLFMVSGAAILALTLAWLRGFQLRSRFRKYQAVFEFREACGICVGTPVRIRGVAVGNVVRVDSSLKSIDATVEVRLILLYVSEVLKDSNCSLECSSSSVTTCLKFV